jgi:hypothetical protein
MVVFAATAAGHFFVELIRLQNLHILRAKANPRQTMETIIKILVNLISIREETVNIADTYSA